MKFYIFKNSADSGLYALTDNDNGDKLPLDHPKSGASWSYWKSFEGGLEGRIGIGLEDEETAQKDIEEQGYHLFPRTRLLKPGN